MALTTIDNLDLRATVRAVDPGTGADSTTLALYRRAYEDMIRQDIRIPDGFFRWDNAVMTRTREPEPLVEPTMPPKPEPFTPNLPALNADLAEYDTIAAELGFAPTELKKERTERARHDLIGFMLDSGMPIYNEDHVKRYMDGIVATKNYEAAKAKRDKGGAGVLGMDVPVIGWKWKTLKEYKHAIPIDILKRAKAIKAEHPTAEFSVTDYEVTNPDPFISVTINGCARVIFGVWDEPGFKAIGRDAKEA